MASLSLPKYNAMNENCGSCAATTKSQHKKYIIALPQVRGSSNRSISSRICDARFWHLTLVRLALDLFHANAKLFHKMPTHILLRVVTAAAALILLIPLWFWSVGHWRVNGRLHCFLMLLQHLRKGSMKVHSVHATLSLIAFISICLKVSWAK